MKWKHNKNQKQWDAEAKGANAIIGMRLMSSSVMNGAAEMVAYGTAVGVE